MSDYVDARYAIRKEDLNNVKRTFKMEYKDYIDDMGWSPLHWACGYNKDNAIVQYLLNNGCNIEAQTTNNKWRPIHLAVFNGSTPIVMELIERGCLVNAQTARKETPLDVAVDWKKEKCAEILRNAQKKLTNGSHRRVSEENGAITSPVPCLTNFKKGNLLGQGGFGMVYKCLDLENGHDFALKEVLLYPCNAFSKEVKCLENEISIYTKLMNHPRIVQYFGTVQDANSMTIFMEYMAGGSIKDQIVQYGPLTPTIIVRYVKQILEGLVFLHHKMIIHRDIKASNILRDIHGNVKLSDFGTSRFLERISLNSISLVSNARRGASGNTVEVQTNTICGTFYWMAPEVIQGKPYSISADVWSLGATVVEMLTGNHPYHDLEPIAAMFRIGQTKKIDFRPPAPISKDFQSFIHKTLEPDPHKRASVESLLKTNFILQCSQR